MTEQDCPCDWCAGYEAGYDSALDDVLQDLGTLRDTDEISDALEVVRQLKAKEVSEDE